MTTPTPLSPIIKSKNRVIDFDNIPAALIKYNDLSPEVTEDAIYICKYGYSLKLKGDIIHYKDIAELIKKDFDNKYGVAWHCIVGSSFGSYVSHESKNIIYLFIGNMGVLLFKHG